jgi:hypothetical protein
VKLDLTELTLPLIAASMAFAFNAHAQAQLDPNWMPPWADTTGESGVYPVGDAIGVYRAALDLLYIDGDKKPSIIVMHDTAEHHGDGPCPIPCDRVWPHKSKIDTTAILSFARASPKRPGIRVYGYSIPIVLVSDDDFLRMRRDGRGYFWTEFRRRYPEAWGYATLTKVGFNDRHTEALVQVGHWCGDTCGSKEILFLRRVGSRWTVVERIPAYVAVSSPSGNLRYRGPSGASPSESELIVAPSVRSAARSESVDATAVYRAVLDSLYSFQGDSPKMVVLTDRYRMPDGPLPPHRSRVDSLALQKYAFFGPVHALPDPAFNYRLPIAILSGDSIPKLDQLGVRLEREHERDIRISAPFWFAFRKKYPGAWGMVGFSRVAFNLERTQALVYSNHQCGDGCDHGDTWVLERSREQWRIVERIPNGESNNWEFTWEFEPLRYVGRDATPNSYRHRLAYGAFTNAVTNRPLSFMDVNVHGDTGRTEIFTTDSAGRIALGRMPLIAFLHVGVGCPDQSRPDSIYGLDFLISPGLDTTIDRKIDFRECFRESRQPTARTLSGAEAFISATEARFVFPRRAPGYVWDLPIKGAYPGSVEYWWLIDWNGQQVRDGEDPVSLWLMTAWKQGGPRKGSLAELIAGRKLDPMINCVTCHEAAVFRDPDTDHRNVFASVEDGRLVFTVRGREAVKHIFPVIPATVLFEAVVRQIALREYGPGDTQESQRVFVNCRNSDSSAAARRRCNVPAKTQKLLRGTDPSAPRRIHVVVLSYDGASLMRNLDVRIQSEDKREGSEVRSTGSAGSFLLLHPASDSVTLEALCPDTHRAQRTISGRFGLYVAPGADTTVQMLVDPQLCSR